jgi:hypothetical protein
MLTGASPFRAKNRAALQKKILVEKVSCKYYGGVFSLIRPVW